MPATSEFRSLRLRLLLPIVSASLLVAVVVAVASYWQGARWAEDELRTRFQGIRDSLEDASFPLNATVLGTLAELTQTELVAVDQRGQVVESSLGNASGYSDRALEVMLSGIPDGGSDTVVDAGETAFRVYSFLTLDAQRADRVATVAVLFDQRLLDASRRRAALLPLVTGMSTLFAISSITLLLSSKLVRRIGGLKSRVEAVAAGNFQSVVANNEVDDELGRLAEAVNVMARQLDQLWHQVNRQQSEKLLHQIASGMAHQLRNSLTGARMAIELHARTCEQSLDEGLRVALHQIDLSEDYIRRLVLAASGRRDEDRPMSVASCLHDVRSAVSPTAQHLNVNVDWPDAEVGSKFRLADGPAWTAAVTNLVQNAMQAGTDVRVNVSTASPDRVQVTVSDNGDGVPNNISEELFEPFVTSKPEGMGLGLSVVRRAAESLGGNVRWRRENERTVFQLDAQVTVAAEAK